MIASSVFVLAALTMTGLYMREQNEQAEDNGYTLDLTALEESQNNQGQEIAQNVSEEPDTNIAFQENNEADNRLALQENKIEDNSLALQENAIEDTNLALQEDKKNTNSMEEQVTEDDLDFMPLEANSGLVEIPELTESENKIENKEEKENKEDKEDKKETDEEKSTQEQKEKQTGTGNVIVSKQLLYSEEGGLLRPLGGEILMPYSMEGSIYFKTLDQYKYNPAVPA